MGERDREHSPVTLVIVAPEGSRHRGQQGELPVRNVHGAVGHAREHHGGRAARPPAATPAPGPGGRTGRASAERAPRGRTRLSCPRSRARRASSTPRRPLLDPQRRVGARGSTTGRLQPSTRALERRKRTDQLPSGGHQKHRRVVPAERPTCARSASAMLDQSGRVGSRARKSAVEARELPALSPPGRGAGSGSRHARVAPNLVEQPPALPRVPAQALAHQLRASEALTSSPGAMGASEPVGETLWLER